MHNFACHVTVYRLDVTEVLEEWPEARVRRREWVSADEAIDRIGEPGLRDLLRQALAMECGLPG